MQSIEESCDPCSELRIHARVPVLARPHARGASRGDLQPEACRASRAVPLSKIKVGATEPIPFRGARKTD